LNKNATDRIIQGNPIVIDLGETEFSVLV